MKKVFVIIIPLVILLACAPKVGKPLTSNQKQAIDQILSNLQGDDSPYGLWYSNSAFDNWYGDTSSVVIYYTENILCYKFYDKRDTCHTMDYFCKNGISGLSSETKYRYMREENNLRIIWEDEYCDIYESVTVNNHGVPCSIVSGDTRYNIVNCKKCHANLNAIDAALTAFYKGKYHFNQLIAPFYDESCMKYGYADPYLNIQIPAKYDSASSFVANRAKVIEHGVEDFITTNGITFSSLLDGIWCNGAGYFIIDSKNKLINTFDIGSSYAKQDTVQSSYQYDDMGNVLLSDMASLHLQTKKLAFYDLNTVNDRDIVLSGYHKCSTITEANFIYHMNSIFTFLPVNVKLDDNKYFWAHDKIYRSQADTTKCLIILEGPTTNGLPSYEIAECKIGSIWQYNGHGEINRPLYLTRDSFGKLTKFSSHDITVEFRGDIKQLKVTKNDPFDFKIEDYEIEDNAKVIRNAFMIMSNWYDYKEKARQYDGHTNYIKPSDDPINQALNDRAAELTRERISLQKELQSGTFDPNRINEINRQIEINNAEYEKIRRAQYGW